MKAVTKLLQVALVAGALVLSAGANASKEDDKKWIDKCVKDNKNEGAKPEVVRKYCTCMNDKMDDNETRSITEWEKANPKAMKECEKAAGWK